MTEIVVKEKSKTFVGALEEIEKCILAGLGHSKLDEELKRLTEWLLTDCQTNLVRFKAHAASRGKPWQGKILLTAEINEQDGFDWWHKEIVELEQEIRYLIVAGELCGDIDRKEMLEWIISKDETSLLKVHHQITKTFKKEAEEMVLLERLVDFKDNTVSRAIITKNTDFPIITEANFYYKPAKGVIRHEYTVSI